MVVIIEVINVEFVVKLYDTVQKIPPIRKLQLTNHDDVTEYDVKILKYLYIYILQ